MKSAKMFLCLLLVGGCTTAHTIRLKEAKYPPVENWKDIQIFLAAEDVAKPFDKIAIIKTRGEAKAPEDVVIWEAQKEAAKIGAHGIILESIQEPNSAIKFVGIFNPGVARRQANVIAIRYTEPDSMATQ